MIQVPSMQIEDEHFQKLAEFLTAIGMSDKTPPPPQLADMPRSGRGFGELLSALEPKPRVKEGGDSDNDVGSSVD